MPSNEYQFLTRWRVPGRVEDAFDIIRDVPRYPVWWPEVYLKVTPIDDGFRLLTKGLLPYKLRWDARTVEAVRPHRILVAARGDFNGRGVWTLRQNGDFTELEFDWRIRADKPLLRYLSFLFKPVFSANHRWAMEQGESGLAGEMRRMGGEAGRSTADQGDAG